MAFLYIVTTITPDPLDALTFMSQNQLPAPYDEDYMDKSFLRHYVLIHDESQDRNALVEYVTLSVTHTDTY